MGETRTPGTEQTGGKKKKKGRQKTKTDKGKKDGITQSLGTVLPITGGLLVAKRLGDN